MMEYLLKKGLSLLIDEEDTYLLNQFNWSLLDGYLIRREAGEIIRLHREILKLNNNDGLIADHINLNRLDNRRFNLRVTLRSGNLMNRDKFNRSDCSSQFKGVRFLPINGYFQSRVSFKGKTITIGHYHDEIIAANAYNHLANKLHGEYARFNKVNFINVAVIDENRIGNNLKPLREQLECPTD